jgi:ribosomal-protein-serine acetyltransferase
MTFRLTVPPEIELRLWEPCHAESCFAAVERNRVSLREWLPWVDGTRSAEDIRAYIQTVVTPQFGENKGPSCGIWVGDNLAGGIGCHAIDWAHRNCSIGYWLDARYRGKGLMTRCCVSLLNYLFIDQKLHRVSIRCATGNHASCAIPKRLGFRQEGVEREAEWVGGRWVDLLNWAILDHEWRQSSHYTEG